MTWFDVFALGILVYFIIRGFLSGFTKTLFSLIGMIVAYFYSGTISLKITPVIYELLHLKNPKTLSIIGFIVAFVLIYITFVVIGFFISALSKSICLGSIDRLAGALFGFIKGTIFITFVYLVVILAAPSQKNTLTRSLCYPLVKQSLKLSAGMLSNKWKDFIKKYSQ